MGQFIFHIPNTCPFDKRLASTVHVVGLDGIPGPGRVQFADGILVIQRNQDESGHVFLSWPVAGFGELVLGTGTLPENDAGPAIDTIYWLDVEIARGTVNRLRNQLSLWSEGGLHVDPEVLGWSAAATAALGRAIMINARGGNSADHSAERHREAAESIRLATMANFRLAQNFSRQVFPFRLQQSTTLAERSWTGIAAGLSPSLETPHLNVEDCADFPVVGWNHWVESKHPSQLQSNSFVLGPLLDASPDGLSADMKALDNFESRRLFLLQQIKRELSNPLATPTWVHAVGGLNGMGHRLLNYPQQLQFTVDIVQALEELLPATPIMVSFDGPWGERLAWSVGGAHALQIADSLLRRGLRINLLGLDINLDYWPQGSLLRDPVQWIDLVDLWSQLGLPLVVHLRAASGQLPVPTGERPSAIRNSCSELQMCELLSTVVPMLLSRPMVRAVVWQQQFDRDDPRFPHGGLLDDSGQLKPIGQAWQNCRRRYRELP